MTHVLCSAPSLLQGMLTGWLPAFSDLIEQICRRALYLADLRMGDNRTVRCQVIPPDIYKRPDPLIYDQYYLMALGLAVTWDNPDIELRRNGVPVPSSAIDPDTDYEVVARIWNGSIEAPAVNMPVNFSYLDFGIGTTRIPIGQTIVDLPVRGAPGHPAFATMLWHTPTTPGHYCLLVELIWADDANPNNNLGQENVNVRSLSSPAQFEFPVRNNTQRPQILHLEVDTYRIPPLKPCDPEQIAKTPEMTDLEINACLQDVFARNQPTQFPVPEGWSVEISPRELRLAPGDQHRVTVIITAPEGFRGRQAFNVNAFDRAIPVGGVTLFVEG